MNKYTVYENPSAQICILQLQGEHERKLIESELDILKSRVAASEFCLLTIRVDDWERELSPWEAPSPFGDGTFGSGANHKLCEILNEIIPDFEKRHPNPDRKYYLTGYSLAGLFSLWAAYECDKFEAVAAVSPSVWYPDWSEFISKNQCKAKKVYLSLGNKESMTRNKTVSVVKENIMLQHETLEMAKIKTVLEWNEGNHFANVAERMSNGIIWLLETIPD